MSDIGELTLSGFNQMGKSVKAYVDDINFTGLSGTPENYQQGQYLVSTADGLQWVAAPAGGGVTSYASVGALPTTPTRGTLATVGCDLYIACDGGEWQKVLKDGEQEPIAANAQVPSCVTSINDQIIYNDYRTTFVADYAQDVFEREFNGDPQVDIHEVCVHSEDSRNIARIVDPPANIFKFGLFYGDTGVDITAVPRNANIKFEGWRSSTNQGVFGDANSANTTLQVTESMDIYALFSGFITSQKINLGSQIANANTISIEGNVLAAGSYGQRKVVLWTIAENGDLTYLQTLNGGQNFGIAIALNEDATILAVSDYQQNTQSVYLYEKQANGLFSSQGSSTTITRTGLDNLSFSSDLSWKGNKLYCSAYQRFNFYVYDIDANANSTLEQILFYDPNNERFVGGANGLMSNTNWGFGNKINVKNNLAVVLGKHTVNILNYNTLTSEWEVVQNECFTFRDKLDLTKGNGKTLTLQNTSYYLQSVEIQDDNNIWVGDVANTIIDGIGMAGAVYKFTKQGGTWTHTQTITQSSPTANTYFAHDIDIQGSQLFVTDYGQNEIEVFNI